MGCSSLDWPLIYWARAKVILGDADALSKMGETADQLLVLSVEHAEQEMLQFKAPLQDYRHKTHSCHQTCITCNAIMKRDSPAVSYMLV